MSQNKTKQAVDNFVKTPSLKTSSFKKFLRFGQIHHEQDKEGENA